jgi:hypothetical protein
MREQGQGSIRQRGPQHWELKFDLGRDPASGKRITRYVTFHGTKREAQAELNRLLTRRFDVNRRQLAQRDVAKAGDDLMADGAKGPTLIRRR